MSEEKPERVGYRHPPRAARWKKGQSGNPRGARSGLRHRTPRQIAEDITSRTIMHGGRTLTYLDIILIHVFNKASGGNKRARRLLERIGQYQQATPEIWLITRQVEKLMGEEFGRQVYAEKAPGPPPTHPLAGKSLIEISHEYHRRIQAMKDDYND